MVSLSPYADMEDALQHGLTFSEYFARGTIPLPQLTLFERAWNLLIANRTERNGYEAHPNDLDEEVPKNEPKTALNGKIDTDTGEVIVNYTEVDPDDPLPWE